jgi:hypothetical protein
LCVVERIIKLIYVVVILILFCQSNKYEIKQQNPVSQCPVDCGKTDNTNLNEKNQIFSFAVYRKQFFYGFGVYARDLMATA